jgi:ankyrin repeat protein
VQSPELVDYLLSQGADVNAEDVQRKTALHYAVQERGRAFFMAAFSGLKGFYHLEQKWEGR